MWQSIPYKEHTNSHIVKQASMSSGKVLTCDDEYESSSGSGIDAPPAELLHWLGLCLEFALRKGACMVQSNEP